MHWPLRPYCENMYIFYNNKYNREMRGVSGKRVGGRQIHGTDLSPQSKKSLKTPLPFSSLKFFSLSVFFSENTQK